MWHVERIVVIAPIFSAAVACMAGDTIWSFVEMRAHVGLFFHAATVSFSSNMGQHTCTQVWSSWASLATQFKGAHLPTITTKDSVEIPLAEAAPGILGHMNADHVDSMVLLARSQAHIEAAEATMTAVDRLGFNLRLKTDDGMKGTRINFPREVSSPQDTRAILVEMVRQAKQ